jgi:hypothetical protein
MSFDSHIEGNTTHRRLTLFASINVYANRQSRSHPPPRKIRLYEDYVAYHFRTVLSHPVFTLW